MIVSLLQNVNEVNEERGMSGGSDKTGSKKKVMDDKTRCEKEEDG
jgi:hypothetical protein